MILSACLYRERVFSRAHSTLRVLLEVPLLFRKVSEMVAAITPEEPALASKMLALQSSETDIP